MQTAREREREHSLSLWEEAGGRDGGEQRQTVDDTPHTKHTQTPHTTHNTPHSKKQHTRHNSQQKQQRTNNDQQATSNIHNSRDVRPVMTNTASQGQKLASSETEAELFQLYEDELGGRRTDRLAGVKHARKGPASSTSWSRPSTCSSVCSGAPVRSWALPATVHICTGSARHVTKRNQQAGCVSHSQQEVQRLKVVHNFYVVNGHSWAARLDTGSWSVTNVGSGWPTYCSARGTDASRFRRRDCARKFHDAFLNSATWLRCSKAFV